MMYQIKNQLNKIKNELNKMKNEENGQGAAEYILLFGGVIVIAIAALLIYRSYFASGSTSLNASTDVNDVRTAMNSS